MTASYKPSEFYGGPIVSVAALCEALAKLGHQVDVYTTTADGDKELDVQTKEFYNLEGVRVMYFKRWTGDHTHLSPALFLRLIQKSAHYDIVHIHSWWNLVSVFAAFTLRWKKAKVVISPRGAISRYSFENSNVRFKKIIHGLLGKRLLRSAHHHATTQKELNDSTQIDRRIQVTTIPNIVNPPAGIHKNYLPKSQVQFCFLGRINPVKNLEYVFDVLSGLTIDWTLHIGGSGEDDYVDELVAKSKQLGIEDRITWHGNIPMKDRYEFLQQSDCLLIFSYTENYSNVAAEAISIGLAVITTEGVGISEQVKENNQGWVIDYDVFRTTEEMNRIFAQSNWYEQLDLNSYQKQSNQIIDKYVKMYETLLTNTPYESV